MKKQKLLAATGLYALFLFIGHHGPLANHGQKYDDHPHTHQKHVIKFLKEDEDLGRLQKSRKYAPLTV